MTQIMISFKYIMEKKYFLILFFLLFVFFCLGVFISEFFVFCDAPVDSTSSVSDVDSKLQKKPISNAEVLAIITVTHVVIPIVALYFIPEFANCDPLTTSALITSYSTTICYAIFLFFEAI